MKHYIYIFGFLMICGKLTQEEQQILKKAIIKIESLRETDTDLEQMIETIYTFFKDN